MCVLHTYEYYRKTFVKDIYRLDTRPSSGYGCPAALGPHNLLLGTVMVDLRRYYIEICRDNGRSHGIHVFARNGYEAIQLASERNPGYRVLYVTLLK